MDLIAKIEHYYKLCLASENSLDYLDKGFYAHWTNNPSLFGINKNRDLKLSGGPNGLYAYEWTSEMFNGGHMKFATDRNYVTLFSVSGKVLDAKSYSEQDFQNDLKSLIPLVEPLLLEKAQNQREKRLLKVDKFKGTLSDVYDLPIGKLYYVLSKLEKKELIDPEAPINYAYPGVANINYMSELFQALGYVGFTDIHGLIFGTEPRQTVFFDMNAINVFKTFTSPYIS